MSIYSHSECHLSESLEYPSKGISRSDAVVSYRRREQKIPISEQQSWSWSLKGNRKVLKLCDTLKRSHVLICLVAVNAARSAVQHSSLELQGVIQHSGYVPCGSSEAAMQHRLQHPHPPHNLEWPWKSRFSLDQTSVHALVLYVKLGW